MSTSVPMDECQSSHIENHYDEAYNHQMRQNKICISLPFVLNLLLLMDPENLHLGQGALGLSVHQSLGRGQGGRGRTGNLPGHGGHGRLCCLNLFNNKAIKSVKDKIELIYSNIVD